MCERKKTKDAERAQAQGRQSPCPVHVSSEGLRPWLRHMIEPVWSAVGRKNVTSRYPKAFFSSAVVPIVSPLSKQILRAPTTVPKSTSLN